MKQSTLEIAARFWVVTVLESTQAPHQGRDDSLPDQLIAIAIHHNLTVEYLIEWIKIQHKPKIITAAEWRKWCHLHAPKLSTTREKQRHKQPEGPR